MANNLAMNTNTPQEPHGDTHAAHNPLAPVFAAYPIDVVRGEGVWLYGRDGRRVLDLYGGHAVAAGCDAFDRGDR